MKPQIAISRDFAPGRNRTCGPVNSETSPEQGYYVGKIWVEKRLVEGCHIWTGCVNSKGYGVRQVDGRRVLVHRAAWENEYGTILDPFEIHHRCGNRCCLRLSRLELVTPLEHKRLHRDRLSCVDWIVDTLETKGPLPRWVLSIWARNAGYKETTFPNALERAVEAGRAYRVERGVYNA